MDQRLEMSLSELQVSALRRTRECAFIDEVVHVVPTDRHIIKMLPSLVEDLWLAREVVVDQQLVMSRLARSWVEPAALVSIADLLLGSYSSTTSGTSRANLL